VDAYPAVFSIIEYIPTAVFWMLEFEKRAWAPTATLAVPTELDPLTPSSAFDPKAVFNVPVTLLHIAPAPNAELYAPLLYKRALLPTAVLLLASVFENNANAPKDELFAPPVFLVPFP
jgi:hypothetical protein